MKSLPRLTRSTAPPAAGMVHLGPGAFFRAFIAPYTDEAMEAGSANGEDWGIIAVSLKNPNAREALVPQGCIYTALERGPDGDTMRQVGRSPTSSSRRRIRWRFLTPWHSRRSGSSA